MHAHRNGRGVADRVLEEVRAEVRAALAEKSLVRKLRAREDSAKRAAAAAAARQARRDQAVDVLRAVLAEERAARRHAVEKVKAERAAQAAAAEAAQGRRAAQIEHEREQRERRRLEEEAFQRECEILSQSLAKAIPAGQPPNVVVNVPDTIRTVQAPTVAKPVRDADGLIVQTETRPLVEDE